MEIFLTHKSALEFWRLNGTDRDALERRHRKKIAPTDPPDLSSMRRLDNLGLTLPMDVTTSVKDSRRVSQLVHSFVLSKTLPQGCIINISKGLFVSSPEFCFMQMANILPEAKLVELGYELCGSYSLLGPGVKNLDPALAEKGFYSRPALTNTIRLNAVISQIEGVNGKRRAMQALQYLTNNSGSPMETILAMLLSLPYRLGGYSFPVPELNFRIIPAKSAKLSASKSFFVCDLFWPDADVVVEYDSDMFHTGAERIASDSKRRNSLTLLGITPITVTSQQIRNKVEFEKVAKQLAVVMGTRLRNKESAKFPGTQHSLRSLLL